MLSTSSTYYNDQKLLINTMQNHRAYALSYIAMQLHKPHARNKRVLLRSVRVTVIGYTLHF